MTLVLIPEKVMLQGVVTERSVSVSLEATELFKEKYIEAADLFVVKHKDETEYIL